MKTRWRRWKTTEHCILQDSAAWCRATKNSVSLNVFETLLQYPSLCEKQQHKAQRTFVTAFETFRHCPISAVPMKMRWKNKQHGSFNVFGTFRHYIYPSQCMGFKGPATIPRYPPLSLALKTWWKTTKHCVIWNFPSLSVTITICPSLWKNADTIQHVCEHCRSMCSSSSFSGNRHF